MSPILLASLILTPLVGALVIAVRPVRFSRWIALVWTTIPLILGVVALVQFDWSHAGDFQGAGAIDWIPQLGLSLSVGVDGVALLLVALTLLLGPIGVVASFSAINNHEREQSYYAWLCVLQAAMAGVFIARDLALFYICFEFTLIPMYVLIRVFGSTNRKRASTKFFLYTFTGSILALAGLVYVVWFNTTSGTGEWTFDIATLQHAAITMSPAQQGWVLAAMLAGFAVKVPLFPVHTWLPLAHTEAPTVGSVLLAGVLLKLGTYGIYRFVLPFTPLAVVEYAPLIAVVCIVGILYAGLICWVQTDVKKLVAYSSVSHLGFCVLGLMALNGLGLSGSVLYMLSHGLSTGALFLLIGMIYERYHTRSMDELGGLAARMPVWAFFMVFFAMASVGLPGLNGFVSEFLCLIGSFQSSDAMAALEPGATRGTLGPMYAAFAGVGMIVAAMYLLYMVGKVVWGPLKEPAGHDPDHHDSDKNELPTDLTRREIAVLTPLAIGCLVLGLYPKPLLDAIEAPVNQSVQWVWTHSGRTGLYAEAADAPAAPIELAESSGEGDR